jgi:site-specific DNA-cytosine methylase
MAARDAMDGKSADGIAPPFREWNRRLWNGQKPGQNGDGKGGCFNHVKLHPDRPSPTVPKSCVFGGFSGLCHWSECRALSIGELAALTSFPQSYQWPSNYEQAHARIGNCVPPRFAQAIAECVRDTILIPAAQAAGKS